jgi:GNAT superfamily N-acetyltransferase
MAIVDYRPAELSDVPALARLRREGEAGGASEERMWRYLAGKHHPQRARLPRVMYMAAAGDRRIGYIAGHLTRRFGCAGELQWIYVIPEHRGTSIAPELLRLLAAWFVGHGARRICVDVGDDHAYRFYCRHGAADLRKHWLVWEDIATVLSGQPPPGASGTPA